MEGTGTGHLPAYGHSRAGGRRGQDRAAESLCPPSPCRFSGAEPRRANRPPGSPPAAGPASLLPASPFPSPHLSLSRLAIRCLLLFFFFSFFRFSFLFFLSCFLGGKKKIGKKKNAEKAMIIEEPSLPRRATCFE